MVKGLLSAPQCADLAARFDEPGAAYNHGVMGRHGYGAGEYKYLSHPLPPKVVELRTALYRILRPLAMRWAAMLGKPADYPGDHAGYLSRCAAAGQSRPAPLLLRYREGDYNRLHQDLYGPAVFPFQAVLQLSIPGADFTGGEFLLLEQRARLQSRGTVVSFGQGDAVIFAVDERPVPGARGYARARLRHGVSTVRSGERVMLGIIFHDR